jgi:hypothetical protein
MPDGGHAISAKRLSRKQRKDGNLTTAEFDRINRKGGQGPEGKGLIRSPRFGLVR